MRWIPNDSIEIKILDEQEKETKEKCILKTSRIKGNSVKVAFEPQWVSQKAARAMEIKFSIPISGIAGFWTPFRSSGFENQNFIKWNHQFTASPQMVFPVIAFVDRELGHKGFIACLRHEEIIAFDLALSQCDEKYVLKIRYPAVGYLPVADWCDLSFYLSGPGAGKAKIFNAIREFMVYYDKINPPVPKKEIPASAYQPVYCTWYAVHGSPTAAWAEKTAELAAELGFKNFIMDDGWQYEKLQRIDANAKEWFAQIDDWRPAKNKFPDFKAHVQKIRAAGLKYILWWNPYAVGRRSKTFPKYRALTANKVKEMGCYYYCAQDRRVLKLVARTALRLVRDYQVDGFKVDYLYGLAEKNCVNEKHEHFSAKVGAGMVAGMTKVYRDIKKIRPDFDMCHCGGPVMHSFASSLRGADVPFDPDTNLYFLIYLRCFSSYLPLQSDPLFWPKNASCEEINRHFIVAMFAVPSVSVDLLSLPDKVKRLIKNWLAFYSAYSRVLCFGKLQVENCGPLISALTSRENGIAITAVFRQLPVTLEKCREHIFLNATSQARILVWIKERRVMLKTQVFDAEFCPVDKKNQLAAGINEVAVPAGGRIVITAE
ncbi:MAG: alpha-galactosidase [Kiritimatiellia bacterium]|nr:alpha-galactosidase [Kiritimatiellia bacterium]